MKTKLTTSKLTATQRYQKRKRRAIDLNINVYEKIKLLAEHYSLSKSEFVKRFVDQVYEDFLKRS